MISFELKKNQNSHNQTTW